MSYIVNIYADLIRKGVKTIDQVPEPVREEVASLVEPAEKKAGTNN